MKKICFIENVAYICTRIWNRELIEGIKEIGFRLQEEGESRWEKAGKNISIFFGKDEGID